MQFRSMPVGDFRVRPSASSGGVGGRLAVAPQGVDRDGQASRPGGGRRYAAPGREPDLSGPGCG